MHKYPSSILVSLYTSLIITIFFAVISGDFENPQRLVVEALIFFTLTFLVSILVLETIVYRRLKHLDALNQREIQKLKEMEAFRREFIGDVSHELKTPIFAIEGFIETLLGGAMHDDQVAKKFLKRALKQSERLSDLVEDLLVISQIESGDLEMKITDFSIYDAIIDVTETLEHKLTKKNRNITLSIEPGEHESTLVKGDPSRIEQVLHNLVDNAIKYGDRSGTIKIALESYPTGKVLVKVADEGQGIKEEHLPRLFERFYRVDKSRSRQKGGTGLGLAICKHLIEAHKQKIWVNSVEGEGSTFQFTLMMADEQD